jgi:hypothetical protein
MGLDMYAFTVKQGEELSDESRVEVAYWRKFNALHGWMNDLYESRGGEGEFNCVPLQLTPMDIDQLERDAKAGLRPREGFFFGAQTIHEEDLESLAQFIQTARDAFASGKDVYYDSWW